MPKQYTNKEGIVKTFIVIVFGILLLAHFGFDIRGHVEEFQSQHQSEINGITSFIFNNFFPASKDIVSIAQDSIGNSDQLDVKKVIDVVLKFFITPQNINSLSEGLNISDGFNNTSTSTDSAN